MILVTIDYRFKPVAAYTCPVIPLNNLYLIVRNKNETVIFIMSLRRQYNVNNLSRVIMDTYSVKTYCTVNQNISHLVFTKR